MRETEAAATLQITPRTLLRYRRSGKLAYRELKGKTRPLIDYDPADVEALKAELERRRARSAKPQHKQAETGGGAMRKGARRVSFGLPPEGHTELSQEAERYGMSVGEYARRLVREGLESRFAEEAAELRAEAQKVRAELERMRADFAGGFEALLEFTGLAPEEAKQWVTDNLR